MPALVYVVDDEEVIASTLVLILKSSGYDAVSFVNPLEALHAAESVCPDILISDVMLPQMNGVDLAIQFKALYPTCRVLLFSGQAATTDLLSRASESGHTFDVLPKPIHPKELLDVLKA